MNQVAKLIRKLFRELLLLKIFYFSADHQFFQTSPEIKRLYDRDRKSFHLLAGDA